jgi:hypothetical protein
VRCQVSFHLRAWSVSIASLFFLGIDSGCYAGLPGSTADGGAPEGSSDDAAHDDADESGDSDGDEGSDGEPQDCDGEARAAAMPGIVRLTHVQYDHSVQDLFGLDVQPSAAFRPDPGVAGFDNNA